MAISDLIPWSRGGRDLTTRRSENYNPVLTLHREMNRLFDDVFRGFDVAPFGGSFFEQSMNWPSIEVNESDKDVKVTANNPLPYSSSPLLIAKTESDLQQLENPP